MCFTLLVLIFVYQLQNDTKVTLKQGLENTGIAVF